MKRRWLIAALIVLTLVAAGCSKSKNSSTATTVAKTRSSRRDHDGHPASGREDQGRHQI